jgi:hypothetical protein
VREKEKERKRERERECGIPGNDYFHSIDVEIKIRY